MEFRPSAKHLLLYATKLTCEEKAKVPTETNNAAKTATSHSTQTNSSWLDDSGALQHYTHDINDFVVRIRMDMQNPDILLILS